VKRAAILAAAATIYLLAAWMVAPGFYDGFGPPQPYNWTCPPPQAGANLKPTSGHADIKVVGGVSEAGSAFDNDGQIVMSFLPGAFDATGKTAISVDVAPLPTCPQPSGILFVTNVYRMTADAPLVKPANLRIRYSNLEPDPTNVYFASDPAGPWKTIPTVRTGEPFVIDASTSSFGYFAAGYPSSSPASGAIRIGGGQVLPIVVAVIIGLVVLAGIPLALLRGRQSGGAVREEDEV
jgi:hypothetical protein